MKPKIAIEGHDITRIAASIRVLFNGRELVTARDIDHESGDASKCCELLAAMRAAGLIDLQADESAAKQWARELGNMEVRDAGTLEPDTQRTQRPRSL
jgi:hypothetical protein